MPGYLRRGSGSLRCRVQLQSRGETRLADGTVEPTWATDRVLWAAIEPLREDERVEANRNVGIRTHRVRIRTPQEPLTATQRFLYQDRGRTRIFLIDGVTDIHERRAETECRCVEVDDDGNPLY